MIRPAIMVGVGEVLWDILPSGRVLGGAPSNFAYMTTVLGDRGFVASRVGRDDLGREACRVMKELGLSTAYLQYDDTHTTGTATVSIDAVGQPNFMIQEPVAWDFLQWTSDWQELSANADVICFGSLAQRSPLAAATIECFLRNAPKKALRIFDVNLRQSFYNRDLLRRSLNHADIVKLNDQELLQVSELLKLGPGTEEILARRLLQECERYAGFREPESQAPQWSRRLAHGMKALDEFQISEAESICSWHAEHSAACFKSIHSTAWEEAIAHA
jgi:fructokinase